MKFMSISPSPVFATPNIGLRCFGLSGEIKKVELKALRSIGVGVHTLRPRLLNFRRCWR